MKILLTADIHIKLGQKNVPVDWAINRYNMFFDKISVLEDDHDMHIISGDLFDRYPTLPELQLYYTLIGQATIPTVITTGNHEAETKKRSFLEYLKHSSYSINNNVHVCTEISAGADFVNTDAEFYVVPYEYIKKEKTWKDLPSVPIFTHVRGAIEPHVKPEIPLDWLKKFPVVFAGDLHSHKNTQQNIVYPGSPMTTAFHRSRTSGSNGYLSIDTTNWTWEWADFELPQLIRKTITDKSDMVATDFDHTIYELEGSLDSVSGKVNSELLDKKIVRRSSEATLVLNDKMELSEELLEYLNFILELDNTEDVMGVYFEYN